MKIRSLLVTGMLSLLVACASKQAPPADQQQVLMAEPEQQYMCVAKVYLSDASRAQEFTGRIGGDHFVVPVGEMLAKQLAARFWLDSAALASGRPQPTVTAGFAQGTGVRPASLGDAEAQVVLQFQVLRPTGQGYYDTAAGRATAGTAGQATAQALEQALRHLESALLTAGICRGIQ